MKTFRLELALIVGIVFFCCWCAYIIVKMNSSVGSPNTQPQASNNAPQQQQQQQQQHYPHLMQQPFGSSTAHSFVQPSYQPSAASGYNPALQAGYMQPHNQVPQTKLAAGQRARALYAGPAHNASAAHYAHSMRSPYSAVSPVVGWPQYQQQQWPQQQQQQQQHWSDYVTSAQWRPQQQRPQSYAPRSRAPPTQQQRSRRQQQPPPAFSAATIDDQREEPPESAQEQPAAEQQVDLDQADVAGYSGEPSDATLQQEPPDPPESDAQQQTGDSDDAPADSNASQESAEDPGDQVAKEIEDRVGQRSYSDYDSEENQRDVDGKLVRNRRKHLINGRPVDSTANDSASDDSSSSSGSGGNDEPDDGDEPTAASSAASLARASDNSQADASSGEQRRPSLASRSMHQQQQQQRFNASGTNHSNANKQQAHISRPSATSGEAAAAAANSEQRLHGRSRTAAGANRGVVVVAAQPAGPRNSTSSGSSAAHARQRRDEKLKPSNISSGSVAEAKPAALRSLVKGGSSPSPLPRRNKDRRGNSDATKPAPRDSHEHRVSESLRAQQWDDDASSAHNKAGRKSAPASKRAAAAAAEEPLEEAAADEQATSNEQTNDDGEKTEQETRSDADIEAAVKQSLDETNDLDFFINSDKFPFLDAAARTATAKLRRKRRNVVVERPVDNNDHNVDNNNMDIALARPKQLASLLLPSAHSNARQQSNGGGGGADGQRKRAQASVSVSPQLSPNDSLSSSLSSQPLRNITHDTTTQMDHSPMASNVSPETIADNAAEAAYEQQQRAVNSTPSPSSLVSVHLEPSSLGLIDAVPAAFFDDQHTSTFDDDGGDSNGQQHLLGDNSDSGGAMTNASSDAPLSELELLSPERQDDAHAAQDAGAPAADYNSITAATQNVSVEQLAMPPAHSWPMPLDQLPPPPPAPLIAYAEPLPDQPPPQEPLAAPRYSGPPPLQPYQQQQQQQQPAGAFAYDQSLFDIASPQPPASPYASASQEVDDEPEEDAEPDEVRQPADRATSDSKNVMHAKKKHHKHSKHQEINKKAKKANSSKYAEAKAHAIRRKSKTKKGGKRKKKNKAKKHLAVNNKHFRGRVHGSKHAKGAGNKGAKKGLLYFKDKGYNKRGFKNDYRKLEVGDKKTYFDVFRDKDHNKKWKNFKDKNRYSQSKVWKGGDVKKYKNLDYDSLKDKKLGLDVFKEREMSKAKKAHEYMDEEMSKSRYAKNKNKKKKKSNKKKKKQVKYEF